MAIKNLFGRGVGFGAVHWVVTHGYSSGVFTGDWMMIGTMTVPEPRCLVMDAGRSVTFADPSSRPTFADPSVTPTISAPEAS